MAAKAVASGVASSQGRTSSDASRLRHSPQQGARVLRGAVSDFHRHRRTQ